ncbi:MAG: NHLP family bacteriocin export ABC transporter peptidase/permease/ATPase subunit [Firmicutes bacterium]|nr:NHLP family bacteriocin export ABC transporter peptidase/permease/ATPase subunit [Bacillota bacterium]
MIKLPEKKAKKRVKVPVIMQMEMLECGAASLAMVLAYYKKWIPLEKVREDCAVSRDGSTAKYMLMAARNYGLTAKGFKGEVASVQKATFPCIIHWNFNHFVVLTGFCNKYAYINDPASGETKVPMEVFNRSFTGVYMTFEPGDEFKPEGRPQSVMKFARERLKGTATPIIFVVFTMLLTSLIGIINPVMSRVFLDRVLTGYNPDWFTPIILGMLGLAGAFFIVSIINALYLLKIRGKLAIVANATFLWHILRLPVSFFSQRMAGDITGRLKYNEAIAETLISKLAPLFLNFILTILYFVIMVRFSLVLTAIGLFAVVVNMIMARIISKRRINITRTQMRDEGRLSGLTLGGIKMIETIKSSGAENGFFEQWAGIRAAVNRSKVEFIKTNTYLGAIPEFVSSVTQVAILITGAYLILMGEFTPGMLLAFQGFLMAFSAPVASFIDASQCIQEMRVTMERVEDVFKCSPDGAKTEIAEDTDEYDKLSGNIEIKGVSFGYNKLINPLINDFNMTVKAGSSVAFVGSSGCGKSTLTKLISGLYSPWAGEILFDGMTITQINRNMFTSSVAVVDQDITIFEDSISDNVKLWDNSIEDFEAILACRDAGIHHDILQRPDGYKHMMAEGGKNFSGGQRQRLEIARALASDPAILIMDEATSALDAKTEFDVANAIRNRGITCIIIAHRLSTIRDCDEIIVLDKGLVVERGTHDELMEKGGFYTRLVTTE